MTNFIPINLLFVLPEIILSIAGMALLAGGVFFNKLAKSTPAITIIILLAIFAFLFTVNINDQTIFNGLAKSSNYTNFIKLILVLAAAIVLIFTNNYFNERLINIGYEYYILIIYSLVGMFLMVSANSLITLYMGIELQSLSLYVLAGINKKSAKSSEASLKYFILGAVASCIFLFGASYVYGYTGSFDYIDIKNFVGKNYESITQVPSPLILGAVLVIAALFFKVSAAPFHMWTPDVYEGVKTPVTAYFSVLPKLAGVVALINMLNGTFLYVKPMWQQVVYFAAVASMFIGAFGAITQINFKRLLAYSSIGHIGYALVGIIAGGGESITSTVVYLIIYMFTSLAVFGCIMAVQNKDIDNAVEDEQIANYAGLSQVNPALAFMVAALLLSLAGIPFMAGFFAKFYVFTQAIDAGYIILAILGVIASVISAYYYLKIIKTMYFDEPKHAIQVEMSRLYKVVLYVLVAANLLLFIFVSDLYGYIEKLV